MNEEHNSESEEDFNTRLRRARNIEGTLKSDGNLTPHTEAKGLAFRIGTELVVAVFVGGAIGYSLDHWLNTKPWFLIVFLLLGNASGLWNVFRLTNDQHYTIGFKKRTRRLKNGDQNK